MSTRAAATRSGRGPAASASSAAGRGAGGAAPPVPPVPAFGGGAAVPPVINAANLAAAWQAVQNNNMANAMLAIPQIVVNPVLTSLDRNSFYNFLVAYRQYVKQVPTGTAPKTIANCMSHAIEDQLLIRLPAPVFANRAAMLAMNNDNFQAALTPLFHSNSHTESMNLISPANNPITFTDYSNDSAFNEFARRFRFMVSLINPLYPIEAKEVVKALNKCLPNTIAARHKLKSPVDLDTAEKALYEVLQEMRNLRQTNQANHAVNNGYAQHSSAIPAVSGRGRYVPRRGSFASRRQRYASGQGRYPGGGRGDYAPRYYVPPADRYVRFSNPNQHNYNNFNPSIVRPPTSTSVTQPTQPTTGTPFVQREQRYGPRIQGFRPMRGRGRQQRGRQSRQFYELVNISVPEESTLDPYDDYDENEEGFWDYHHYDRTQQESTFQDQYEPTYDYVEEQNSSTGNFMYADDPSYNYIDAAGEDQNEEEEAFEYFSIVKTFEEIQLSALPDPI